MVSPFDELCPYIVLLLFGRFPFQEGREEKKFKNKKHDEEFDEYQSPESSPQCHGAESVTIEFINANYTVFNHNPDELLKLPTSHC